MINALVCWNNEVTSHGNVFSGFGIEDDDDRSLMTRSQCQVKVDLVVRGPTVLTTADVTVASREFQRSVTADSGGNRFVDIQLAWHKCVRLITAESIGDTGRLFMVITRRAVANFLDVANPFFPSILMQKVTIHQSRMFYRLRVFEYVVNCKITF